MASVPMSWLATVAAAVLPSDVPRFDQLPTTVIYATTVTAAGTTTLTTASADGEYFTGTTTQTLVLPVTSTLVLGRSFLVVNNSTGSPVTILDDGCAPKFRVVLANESVPAKAIFSLECSTQPLVLPVGESRLSIRVQASYGGCSRDAESADGRIPLCVGDTPYAPLPVGSYMATFVGRIPGVVPPEALSMQVTAAGS